eukprot:scaffold6961_cov34-Prasinocladus_malaysianus.AAC.1
MTTIFFQDVNATYIISRMPPEELAKALQKAALLNKENELQIVVTMRAYSMIEAVLSNHYISKR